MVPEPRQSPGKRPSQPQTCGIFRRSCENRASSQTNSRIFASGQERKFGLNAEFKRRLSENWSLHVESAAYLRIDKDDIIYPVRRDSFIGVNLDYSF